MARVGDQPAQKPGRIRQRFGLPVARSSQPPPGRRRAGHSGGTTRSRYQIEIRIDDAATGQFRLQFPCGCQGVARPSCPHFGGGQVKAGIGDGGGIVAGARPGQRRPVLGRGLIRLFQVERDVPRVVGPSQGGVLGWRLWTAVEQPASSNTRTGMGTSMGPNMGVSAHLTA